VCPNHRCFVEQALSVVGRPVATAAIFVLLLHRGVHLAAQSADIPATSRPGLDTSRPTKTIQGSVPECSAYGPSHRTAEQAMRAGAQPSPGVRGLRLICGFRDLVFHCPDGFLRVESPLDPDIRRTERNSPPNPTTPAAAATPTAAEVHPRTALRRHRTLR